CERGQRGQTEELTPTARSLAPHPRAHRSDVELEACVGAQGRAMTTVVVRGEPSQELLGEVAAAIELGPQQARERHVGELRAHARARRVERQRALEVAGRQAVLARLGRAELLD